MYKTKTKDSILPEANPTEVPLSTSQQTNQPPEEESNSSQVSEFQNYHVTELESSTGQLPYNQWNQLLSHRKLCRLLLHQHHKNICQNSKKEHN